VDLLLGYPYTNDIRSIAIKDTLKPLITKLNLGLAFFYCSRNTAELTRSIPKLILASLARQLLDVGLKQPLFQPAIHIYKEKED
jgi:hypothetical protein